jgi:hypothetical protein
MTQISKICKENGDKSPKRWNSAALETWSLIRGFVTRPQLLLTPLRAQNSQTKREYRNGGQANAQANPYAAVPVAGGWNCREQYVRGPPAANPGLAPWRPPREDPTCIGIQYS